MADPFHRREEAKEISEINVVPLADVSLVLLIILLVLSPMMTQTMLRVHAAGRGREPSPAPYAEPAPEKPPELVLVVVLTAEGAMVGDRSFSGLGALASFMAAELERRADKKVFLAPRPDVPHGNVVAMLEMLKSCGASSVALVQTEENQGASSP